MFPIALDLAKIPVLLVGRGPLLERRIKQLEEAGALHVYSHSRESGNPDVQNVWLQIPQQVRDDSKIVMVAGLSREDSEMIATEARKQKKLINVEDVIDLCDFYFTANVRRGDLLIAVSTGGASPTLARRVRDYIARRFGPEWAGYSAEMAGARLALKAGGAGMKEVLTASDDMLAQKGWLDCKACKESA
ncbi:MAG: hypothetical protein EBR02_01505 [Alphaproteobacteria bacterium]|nr:hypothetical protein [Alphaproteobacteria bacterium]